MHIPYHIQVNAPALSLVATCPLSCVMYHGYWKCDANVGQYTQQQLYYYCGIGIGVLFIFHRLDLGEGLEHAVYHCNSTSTRTLLTCTYMWS